MLVQFFHEYDCPLSLVQLVIDGRLVVEYVVKVWVCLVGMVVFLLNKLVISRDKGAAFRSSRSKTASLVSIRFDRHV